MNNEELWQKQAESGDVDGSVDSLAYQKVFNALKKEPELGISPSFADRIIGRLEQRQTSKVSGWEIFLAVIGGLLTIITLTIGIVLTGFKVDLGFLKSMDSYKGIFIFGIAFMIFLHWFDKKIVHKKHVI